MRLCAALSHDSAAAEDLAQETLAIAWTQRHKLHDPSGLWQWLTAIAFNVCRQWLRSRGRQNALLAQPYNLGSAWSVEASVAEEYDIELELERTELAALLDRAMALLPPSTRTLLVEKYIQEKPIAELAEELGTTEGAVAVRLHRGRLALRRVLANNLHGEASAYGLAGVRAGGWVETNIWCPRCGQYRLQSDPEQDALVLRCPACSPRLNANIFGKTTGKVVARNARNARKGHKAILSGVLNWVGEFYGATLGHSDFLCDGCGKVGPHFAVAGGPSRLRGDTYSRFEARCLNCGLTTEATERLIAHAQPEAQLFWRDNPRMRSLPPRSITYQDRPAHVVTFESVTGPTSLDVIIIAEPYDVVVAGAS